MYWRTISWKTKGLYFRQDRIPFAVLLQFLQQLLHDFPDMDASVPDDGRVSPQDKCSDLQISQDSVESVKVLKPS